MPQTKQPRATPPTPTNSCGTCIAFLPDTNDPQGVAGWCRRQPPQVFLVGTAGEDISPQSFFPQTTSDDWCYEWAAS